MSDSFSCLIWWAVQTSLPWHRLTNISPHAYICPIRILEIIQDFQPSAHWQFHIYYLSHNTYSRSCRKTVLKQFLGYIQSARLDLDFFVFPVLLYPAKETINLHTECFLWLFYHSIVRVLSTEAEVTLPRPLTRIWCHSCVGTPISQRSVYSLQERNKCITHSFFYRLVFECMCFASPLLWFLLRSNPLSSYKTFDFHTKYKMWSCTLITIFFISDVLIC